MEVIPVCDCHAEPMAWKKHALCVAGGYWTCKIKKLERTQAWRAKRKAEAETAAAPEGPAPVCECHAEPMRWQKTTDRQEGGYWRCRVSHRDHEANWRRANPEESKRRAQEAEQKRDPVHRRQREALARARNRVQCLDYLGGKCVHCGETDPDVLEFDHIDPTTMVARISSMTTSGIAWSKLQVELDKCQLLCSNCHIKKHRDAKRALPSA